MATDAAMKIDTGQEQYSSQDAFDVCDDLESAKCVVTFLAEMTFFGAFSGKDGMRISPDGETGLHAILTSVTRTIDEAIGKIPSGKGVQ